MAALDLDAPWWSFPIVMFDFETTGVNPQTCMPVSVAAVRSFQGVEQDAFYSLLRPGIPIPPGASAIHGIRDEDVQDAPELLDVAADLFRIGIGAVPAGYNGETYDKPILHRWVNNAVCPLFDPAQLWLDPLVIVRKIDKYERGKGRHKLAAACARWGVPMAEGEAHNALGDVRALGRLLARLVELDKVRTTTSLGRMLAYMHARRSQQNQEYAAYRAKLDAEQATFDFDALDSAKGTP